MSSFNIDPRTLYPTEENLELVLQEIRRIEDLLFEQSSGTGVGATGAADQERTSAYLSLLNDWYTQANTQHQRLVNTQSAMALPAQQLGGRAEARRAHLQDSLDLRRGEERTAVVIVRGPQQLKCLFDEGRPGYAFVYGRKLQQTIYGCVKSAQLVQRDPTQGDVMRLVSPPEAFAIKIFDRGLMDRRVNRAHVSVQEDPITELAVQQFLTSPGHPNVMGLVAALQNERNVFAVFELARGGELFERIATRGPFPEPEGREVFRALVHSTQYIHAAGISNRDISLENFLLGGPGNDVPLMIDFGLSFVLEMDPQHPGRWLPIDHTGPIGKVFYMAPEVFAPRGARPPTYDGPAADVWSLGVCLFILTFGVPPFERPTTSDARFVRAVLQNNVAGLVREWGMETVASDELLQLLQWTLSLQPETRPTAVQILAHPFLNATAGTGAADDAMEAD